VNILCLKLFVNSVSFLLKSKKHPQKVLSNEVNIIHRSYCTWSIWEEQYRKDGLKVPICNTN
jgi:hypothetical protein